MKNKVRKSYRISRLISDELKKTVERLNTTETNFVEVAIMEKIQRTQIMVFKDEK